MKETQTEVQVSGPSISRGLAAGLVLLLLTAAGAVQAGDVPSGEKIFLAHKCNKCHTVESAGISVTKEPGDETDEEESEDKPPDLSGVGSKFDADRMDGWLRKKLTIDGDKHPKRFAGSDAERKDLIEWLRQTKPAKTGA